VLPQAGEEQGPIVFHPKVTPIPDEILEAPVTVFEGIGWPEVLVIEPLLVATSNRRLSNSSLGLDAQKEIDCSLLISICEREGVWKEGRSKGCWEVKHSSAHVRYSREKYDAPSNEFA